jgi:hypothetical protein
VIGEITNEIKLLPFFFTGRSWRQPDEGRLGVAGAALV